MPRTRKVRVQAEVRDEVNIDQLVTAFVVLAECLAAQTSEGQADPELS